MSADTAVTTGPGRRVRILDATLANQIAAGEVVERPASVLKELMENALDAGASRIEVQVERGGAARIRVRDDGGGLHRDDLVLALTRHATSKIASLAELEALVSMGFRGEALPSIASVSRLRMDSRSPACDGGWSILAEGGEPRGEPVPCAQTVGTTVEVRDLFFNTPARRRFLRSERTEARHLELVFRRLALARMDVAMSLEHNGRSVLRLARATDERGRRARLSRLLGSEFANEAIPLLHEVQDLRLEGWLGAVAAARERPDMQYLFVNRRAVGDAMVRHAVRLAHGERLGPGQHPCWVLFLGMSPCRVDVNVHPGKQEVRFHESRLVHDFVRQAVARVLEGGGGARRRPASGRRCAGDPLQREPVAPGASVAPGPPTDDAVHLPLMLLDGDVLLCQRGSQVVLALGSELLEHDVLQRLLAIGDGASPGSRPLLLPERFTAPDRADAALRRGEGSLQVLGLRLRHAGCSWTLLEVPACLATLAPQILCTALQEPIMDPARVEGWARALAAAAGSAGLSDMQQGARLLDRLAGRDPAAVAVPWRELDAQQLRRLLSDRGRE